ncbi:hypothetical protein [Oleiharenicola sp. Vm1]|uniref:hypothetical protein n=1 Tax=Oleiharenicola sp. Vm1 TaxID=3398393 RepID=UPI0039F46338
MTLKQRLGRWAYAHAPFSRRVFDILRGNSASPASAGPTRSCPGVARASGACGPCAASR